MLGRFGLLCLVLVSFSVMACAGEQTFCPDTTILDYGSDPSVTELTLTFRNCDTVVSDFCFSTGYVPGNNADMVADFLPSSEFVAVPPGQERQVTIQIHPRNGYVPGDYVQYIKVYTNSNTECEYGCTIELRMTVPEECKWVDMFQEEQSFPATGGSKPFQVTTDSGCPEWAPVVDSSCSDWVSIILFNPDNGGVSYLVAPNPGSARTGWINIPELGIRHTITQEGGANCTYSVSPTSQTIPASGGVINIDVSTGAGCLWETEKGSENWLRFTTQTYWTGPGTVTYEVDANTGAARSATLTIAGEQHHVVQEAYSYSDCANDTEDPVISSISVIQDRYVELRWSASDNCTPASQLQYRHALDGQAWSAWVTGDWNYAYDYQDLESGTHTFELQAKDSAGNQVSVERRFSVGGTDSGRLQVTIEPEAARAAGAQWRVTSGPDTSWMSSGDILELPAGTYTVTFQEIPGWQCPDDRARQVTASGFSGMTGQYESTGSAGCTDCGRLVVTIEPEAARAAGAQWRVTSGPDTSWRSSGDTLELPAGTYVVTFQGIPGWRCPNDRERQVTASGFSGMTGQYEPTGNAGSSEYNLSSASDVDLLALVILKGQLRFTGRTQSLLSWAEEALASFNDAATNRLLVKASIGVLLAVAAPVSGATSIVLGAGTTLVIGEAEILYASMLRDLIADIENGRTANYTSNVYSIGTYSPTNLVTEFTNQLTNPFMDCESNPFRGLTDPILDYFLESLNLGGDIEQLVIENVLDPIIITPATSAVTEFLGLADEVDISYECIEILNNAEREFWRRIRSRADALARQLGC